MLLKEFKDTYNGAAIELEEFAAIALTVDELRQEASNFLQAKAHFEDMLEIYNVEVG
jgi:hypothetical protein